MQSLEKSKQSYTYNNGFIKIQYLYQNQRWEFVVQSLKPNWVHHTDFYDLIQFPQLKGIAKLYGKVSNYNKSSYNWCLAFGGHIVIENGAYTIFMFVKRFQEEVGIKAVNQYDASHQLTDDDNTHYITAQRAKVGDCVIYNDPIVNKVHIFEGLGNKAWNNAAPGSTLFNYDEIPYDIEMFKRVIAPTAKYLKSLDTL